MNPILPRPPSPAGLPAPARPAPGEFESVLGPVVAAERPKRADVHPLLPMGAIPLLPPLPGLPLFPVVRPDGAPLPAGSPTAPGGRTEFTGPWGIEMGLRITVLEASGGGEDSPSPGTDGADPDIVRWIEEAIRGVPTSEVPGVETGVASARPRSESVEPGPVAANGPAYSSPSEGPRALDPARRHAAPAELVAAAALVAPALEPMDAAAPPAPDAHRARRGGRPAPRAERTPTEDASNTREPAHRDTEETTAIFDPRTLVSERAVMAASPPAESEADLLPHDPGAALTHSLPGRLRLAVEDAAGAWELDLHRHAGVMDLVLRGGDDLRLLVRDAARELREAVSAPGALPGQVRWESPAAPTGVAPSAASEQASTSSGTDQQPTFERWRSLVEGRVPRRKPGANRSPDPVAAAHILDRRL